MTCPLNLIRRAPRPSTGLLRDINERKTEAVSPQSHTHIYMHAYFVPRNNSFIYRKRIVCVCVYV